MKKTLIDIGDPNINTEEKIKNILTLSEKYKRDFSGEKESYEKNRRLINEQRDYSLSFFDRDDVIEIKGELNLMRESDEEGSENSTSNHEEDIELSTINPIPEIKDSVLTKEKRSAAERKTSAEARSKMTVQSPNGQIKKIYLEHNLKKQYPSGITARVKKVFDKEGNLIGAVKIMQNASLAINEAKVSALMPDRADKIFYGQRHSTGGRIKWYIFMPWFAGDTLAQHRKKVLENKIKNPDLSARLDLAKQALEQLKIIHDNNLILGDIHNENLIISITDMKLYLIDFSSAIENKNILNPNISDFSQKDDISYLGVAISDLFPEYLNSFSSPINFSETLTDKSLKKNKEGALLVEKLFTYLIQEMTEYDEKRRPEIGECVKKIDNIININELMNNFSQKIHTTFHQDNSFFEKKLSFNHEIKLVKKTLKRQLTLFFGEKNKIYHQAYRWIKHSIYNEINLYKRELERSRVTPVEELTQNPFLFSWSPPHQKPRLIPKTITPPSPNPGLSF